MPQPAIQDVLTNPNFHGLPIGEQLKVLRSYPTFSALPTKEQGTVLYQAKQKFVGTPTGEDQGALEGISKSLGNTISGAADLALAPWSDPLNPYAVPDKLLKGIYDASAEQVGKGIKLGQEGHPISGLRHATLGAIPMVGPLIENSAEKFSTGRPWEALTDLGQTAIPMLGEEAAANPALQEAGAAAKARVGGAGRVIKAKTQGAFQGAKAAAGNTQGMGAALGEIAQAAAHPILGPIVGGLVGDAVSGFPMVRGALRGAREAQVPPPVMPPPLPRSIPPVWQGMPEPTPQPLPDLSPIPPEYPVTPSGRPAGPLPPSVPSERTPIWQGKTSAYSTTPTPEPVQPPIPYRNTARQQPPASTSEPIRPVGAEMPATTVHHATMQKEFGFMPPSAYQESIVNHKFPHFAIESDAGLYKHLKDLGISKKQFNSASVYQQDLWSKQADLNRGKLPKNIKPMSDDTRARMNQVLE